MEKLLKDLFLKVKNLRFFGKKNAERFVFSLLEAENEEIKSLSLLLERLSAEKSICSNCGVQGLHDPCSVCANDNREDTLLIVENSREFYKLEMLGFFKGRYHVLNGVISPFKAQTFEDLNISNIKDRIDKEGITEVIIGLSPLPEGEITTKYLTKYLSSTNCRITRMAVGIPSGQVVENADDITLKTALLGRIDA